MARGINKYCRNLADDSPSWSLLCKQLWEGKQFHPWEPWVRMHPEEPEESDLIRDQVELLSLLLLFEGAHPVQELELINHQVRLISLFSKRRQAAPISRVIREEQIFLENGLYDLNAEPAHLVVPSAHALLADEIVANISHEVVITDELLCEFKQRGCLLSWRESYIASIIDSTRCCPTYSV